MEVLLFNLSLNPVVPHARNLSLSLSVLRRMLDSFYHTAYFCQDLIQRCGRRTINDGLDRMAAIVMPARHEMHMQMVHFLSACTALIDTNGNAIGQQTFYEHTINVFDR